MKYLFLSLLLISTSLAEGVANKVTPLGPFPATWNQYNKGSVMTWMTNVSQLTTLFANQREPGMSSVINGDTYILAPDLTTWTLSNPLVSVGLASGFSTLNPLAYSLSTILSTLGNTSYTNGSGGYYTIASSTEFPADSLGILATANTNFNVVLVNNGQPWNVRQLGFPTDGNDILAKTQLALYNDRYDKLYFSAGIWPYSTQWAVTNGANGRTNGSISIIGDGSRLTIFRPTSTYSSSAPNSTAPSDNSVAMDFKGFSSVYLKGFSKQYTNPPTWNIYTNWYQSTFVARAYGIRIRNCTNVYLEDVGLLNNIHIGIGLSDCYNQKIINCWVTNSIKDAIVFDSNTSNDSGSGLGWVEGCTVNAYGDTGIGAIESGFITNNPPREFRFINNVVSGAKDFSGRYVFPIVGPQAMTIIGVSDVLAMGNTLDGGIGNPAVIARCGTNFGLNPGTNFVFIGNKVLNGLTNDFYFMVDGYQNVKVSQNIFQNNQGTLGLQSGANVSFTDNTIIGNIQWRPPTNAVTTNLQYIVYSPGGSGTVTYNSITYTNRQTFSGTFGVTNYTFAGDGQMVPRNQGAIRAAGNQVNTTIRGNFIDTIEGQAFTQTVNPDNTFFEDNNIPRSWSQGYDAFYGTILLDVGGDGFILGSRNFFGDSTNYINGTVVINGPNNNRVLVSDYATDLISSSSILGTTNLSLTVPDIGISDFWVYAIQNSPTQSTNSLTHYAFGQFIEQAYSDNHWEQITNGVTSINRRLLREKNYLRSNGGPEVSGWTATTNLQGNFLLNVNFANKVNVHWKMNGQNH